MFRWKTASGVLADVAVFVAAACLLASGVLFLIVSGLSAWHGDVSAGAAAAGVGLVMLLAATIHRFELLKGLGVEARTRQLSAKIERAEEILEQIRKLAEYSATTTVSLSARAGRLGGATPPRIAYEQAMQARELLRTLGTSEAGIRSTLEPWARISAFDVIHMIRNTHQKPYEIVARRLEAELQATLPADMNDPRRKAAHDKRMEFGQLRSAFFRDFSDWNLYEMAERLRAQALARPDVIPEADHLAFRQAVEQWAREIDHLARHLDFRDPEAWISAITDGQRG
jgi:hypothetical protein